MADINPLAKLAPAATARHLSGAAGPAHAARPPLRARRRDRGLSLHARAREQRDRRSCARARRCLLRAGPAEGPRRLARNDRFLPRSVRLRQGARGGCPRWISRGWLERDYSAFCRQGYGALLAEPRGRPADSACDAGDPHRLGRPRRRRGGERARPHRREHRDRHGVDQCARLRQDQIRSRPAQAASRCRRQAQARQLRPRDARTARQPARAAAGRTRVREIEHRSTAAIFAYAWLGALHRGCRRAILGASSPPRASGR